MQTHRASSLSHIHKITPQYLAYLLNRFMLCCGTAEFLFEKWEGAVESSCGMLFYKVICSDSIPEQCVFMSLISRWWPLRIAASCPAASSGKKQTFSLQFKGERKEQGLAKQKKRNIQDEVITVKREVSACLSILLRIVNVSVSHRGLRGHSEGRVSC